MTELKPTFMERLQRFLTSIATCNKRYPALRYILAGVAVFIFTFLLGNNSLFHYVKNQRRKAFIQEEYNMKQTVLVSAISVTTASISSVSPVSSTTCICLVRRSSSSLPTRLPQLSTKLYASKV